MTPFHIGPGLLAKAVGGRHVSVLSVVVGRPICQALLDRWTPNPRAVFETWLRGAPRISRPAAVVGAFVGTYSHVFVDSIMHSDMEPLAPFWGANVLLSVVSPGALHVGCVLSGVFGVLLAVTAFIRCSPAD